MAPKIVILTEPKHSVVLLAMIEHVAPDAVVRFLSDERDLRDWFATEPPSPEQPVRFLAFFTAVVVPPDILAGLGGPAYNFHPGPPAYPGRYPVAMALYDGARRFGATLHVMSPRVDSGPIVSVVEFEVADDADLDWLNTRTHKAGLRLFQHACPALVRSSAPLPTLDRAWSDRRSTRRSVERLCDIPPDIEPDELDRRLRAFAQLAPQPFRMTLHGRRFHLVPDGTDPG
ncbi:formyltransferase family protein [Azospirillum halopraeferens]|uniref:formyltransferase family protein n=1 Tax=Azospirillum halopraeferens TaxID=34010 RepID=UPI000417D75D|nr:formyltransferase family protein [Azospirillum halopraeferens]